VVLSPSAYGGDRFEHAAAQWGQRVLDAAYPIEVNGALNQAVSFECPQRFGEGLRGHAAQWDPKLGESPGPVLQAADDHARPFIADADRHELRGADRVEHVWVQRRGHGVHGSWYPIGNHTAG
jgi:hypothetical protein